MRTDRLIALAASLAALAGPVASQSANNRDQGRTGVRVGTILLEPTLTVSGQYDDNIFRSERRTRSSAILTARAGIAGQTDWRRHSLAVEAGVETGRFTASSVDNYVDANLTATGILDISRAARLRLRAGAIRRHERRGGDDAPAALTGPVKEHSVSAEATGQYAPGRLKFQPFAGIERRDYSDRRLIGGGISDQDDRDRTIVSGGVDVGYNIPGPLEVTAGVRLLRTDFSRPRDRNGFDRDNSRLRVVAGVEVDPERPISGAVEVGYQRQFSDDPSLNDFSGPAAQAQITWRPNRIFTLAVTARRAEEETTITNASAASVAYAEIMATYEIQRFIDLTASAAYERRSFRGAGRRDNTLALGVSAEWRAREDTTVTARYQYIDENSSAPGEGSSANIVWLAIEHRF